MTGRPSDLVFSVNLMRTRQGSRPNACAGLLLTLLLVAGILSGCGSADKTAGDGLANAPVAAVVKVQRRDLSSQLSISSEFQPYQEVNVYAKVSGYIQKLEVNWGTHVKQGQQLAPVSYTHLDVYKRQHQQLAKRNADEAAKQQVEQRHQQQTQQLVHKHTQQTQQLRQRQQPAHTTAPRAPAPAEERPK